MTSFREQGKNIKAPPPLLPPSTVLQQNPKLGLSPLPYPPKIIPDYQRLQMLHKISTNPKEKPIHYTISSTNLLPSSEMSLLCKQGEKSAISSGFILRHVKKSSLLILPSLSESNRLNSSRTCKQFITH